MKNRKGKTLIHVRVTGNRSENKIVDFWLDDDLTDRDEIAEELFELTGGNNDTSVGIEITRADDRPELVGFDYGWDG